MESDAKEQILSTYQLVMAGAFAGTATRFLLQPLDVLKVRFQLQTATKMEEKKYITMHQAVRIVIKEEGIQGLWKGHIPGQCLSIMYGAVQFSVYECITSYLKNKMPTNYARYGHLVNMGSGCASGLLATVVSFPFDTVRTHLIFQGEPKVYKGTFDAIRKIYNKNGPRGFTKGLLPACLSATPLTGLVFFFHEIFSELWLFVFESDLEGSHSSSLSITGNLATGLLAGLCAKTIVYPLDLTKKRLQIQNFDGDRGCCKVTIKCSKITQCFVLTIRNEGFLGLFKGYLPTVLKASATTSLYFTFYDLACQIYKLNHNR